MCIPWVHFHQGHWCRWRNKARVLNSISKDKSREPCTELHNKLETKTHFLPKCLILRPRLASYVVYVLKLYMWRPVKICSACCNTVSQTEWLKQQRFTGWQFWRLEVWNQGVGRVVSFEACRERFVSCLSPWLGGDHLLSVSLHIVFPYVHLGVKIRLFNNTNHIGLGPILMTSS